MNDQHGDNVHSAESVNSSVNKTIKPLYLKNSDLQIGDQTRMTDYDLMICVTKQIGDEVHCLQLDRNLWRIYLKTKDARTKLLSEGLNYKNITVSLYDTNPYSAGINSPDQKTLKVRICGLPLSVDDSVVMELLDNLKIKPTSKIIYEKIRHPVTKRMTSVLNGTRFFYMNPLEEGKYLPRENTCAGLRVRLYHYGQPKVQRSLLCTNCWSDDHTRQFCRNESRCKVCKKEGHMPGDEQCDAFEIQTNITAFSGTGDILSNFFPCTFDVYGIKHQSAEHAFQYTKSIRCGDLETASKIKEAPDALSAKKLGDKVRENDQWRESKFAVMEEIIENKCVQMPMFKEKIRAAKRNTVFVETTFNGTWGSGLDRKGTVNTKQNMWPGKNKLGEIISKIAKKLRKRKKSDQWSRPKSKQNSKENTRQRDIAQMLRDLRMNSDTDSVSGYNASDTDSSEDAQPKAAATTQT
ncbi:hypothetical protein FSP39_004247 [Pinctada imbricata]|uniref:NADAR domain-containing protein n=1 Tax=Pinctada imbricata TaxID=66713 RepID=A0AA89BK69_PINIB|nr:hypothetical protein FSP39_004247 [Pinctada imbricata]